MLQQYPTYCEQPADEFEHNIYSKYQCLERRSSASSTTSTGSNESNQSGNRKKYYVSQMSCQLLNNTFHRNWTEQGLDDCGFDDSLTNLNWLHNVNPMKINEQMSYVHVGYPKDRFVSNNNNNNYQPRNQHMFHNQNPQLNLREPSILTNQAEQYQFNKPDYKNNPNLKPSFTFAVLISWAMKELGTQKITLSDIYGWITENFAYYRHSDSTWQNSVRHNLSTSKYFQRVSREKDEPGKGGFWRMNPNNLKELDNNLMKIKYNPSSHSIMPIKTEKLPVIGSYGQANINKINNISTTNNKSITIHENPRPTISNLTPVKRSRKSPIRTTPENWDWDEKVPRQVINNNNSIINPTNNKNHNNNNNNNNNNEQDKNNYLQYEELFLCDDTSTFSNNGIDFSSIDNSSCDSFPYLSQCPSNDNDISINTFEEDNLGDILTSPMLMEGEEIIYNDDFKSMVYQNDYDLFPTSKDDLQELNTLLGIY